MYCGVTLFDLIAVLFESIIKFPVEECKDKVDEEISDNFEKKANDLLNGKINRKKIFFGDKKCVDSHDFDDIIGSCKAENNFLFYRSVLCQLDLLVNIDDLINLYDFNKFDDGFTNKIFNSLNTNCSETGIIIIPKVPALPNTFFVNKDAEGEDKEYKDGHYWYDNLNEHFNNIICVQESALYGYKINNVVIDLFKNREKDKIVIGVTPCCNTPLDDLMKVHLYQDKDGRNHFAIEEYYNPEVLTKLFIKCLSKAKENNVDILVGPEMLGTPELCNTDEMGFNPIFRDANGVAPHLIITPSLWIDGKNFVSVYLKSGELIGKQFKQNSFELTSDKKRFEEDLKDIPREILLIHVPGWGRIVFPICVDYLVTQYRDLLARDLRVNLMLCPSYSSGIVQFANASGSVRDFGTRLIWLNTCSALRKFFNQPNAIGYASVPVSSPIELDTSAKIICPECNGTCVDGCLFTITIQARSNEDMHCNEVKIKHILK